MWGDTPGEVAEVPQPALPTLEPCWVHFIKKVYGRPCSFLSAIGADDASLEGGANSHAIKFPPRTDQIEPGASQCETNMEQVEKRRIQ
jgi:hypothetical protein